MPHGINTSPIYYTKYELTADTTVAQLLSQVNYHVHYQDCYIRIRANGSVAPSVGNYTVNNYFCLFRQSAFVSGYHYYKSGRVAPDTVSLEVTNEAEGYMTISNGILLSTNTASTSCLGAAGDNVVILEIPFDFDQYTGTI